MFSVKINVLFMFIFFMYAYFKIFSATNTYVAYNKKKVI